MENFMERFTYGPLVYNSVDDISSDEEGNFYWNGFPPVGYDNDDVPIDKDGMQCLPWTSPLHPQFKPATLCYNEGILKDIPTIESFRSWFEDNFLTVTDRDLAFFIVRWISKQTDSPEQEALFRKFSRLSVENTIDTMWPELAENAN